MIPIKNKEEIQKMREACKVAARVLDSLVDHVESGISTYDLDQKGKALMAELGADSACFNYKVGSKCYPAYTCISINEEVVHGIGRLDRTLKPGDCVSLDVVVRYQGFIGDNARTVVIEPVSDQVNHLVNATKAALDYALQYAQPGNRVGEISNAVQRFAEEQNLSVVRDFVGHGVGRSMHEEPQIPNFGPRRAGPKLKSGMTLAIEPMINLGSSQVEIAEDGWTVLTRDRQPSAHFEHTVLICPNGPEILTKI